MIRALLLCAILCVPGLASAQAMVKVKAGSANNYRAMWSAGDRLFRLGIL